MSQSRVSGWTASRYWGFVRSGLRRMFSKYPPKYQCLAASKGGRNEYTCKECGDVYGKKDVAVDHITPCGSLKSYADVSGFVERMFCSIQGLQVLCKTCHKYKTLKERGMSDADIEVAGFRKLPAAKQRYKLTELGVKDVGSNAEQRIEQFRGTI